MFIVRNCWTRVPAVNQLNVIVRQLRGATRTKETLNSSLEPTQPTVDVKDIASIEAPKLRQDLQDKPSVLRTVDSLESVDLVPNFVPTFNFAAYVNKSELLQQFIKLGVDLSKIEKRKGLVQFVLKLDFERDVKNHVIFLTDAGVAPEALGNFITKNPLIFKEDIDDLKVRINYLQAKKFDEAQISRIITKNPYWLMFSTKRIDNRLGFFQVNFGLSGNQTRLVATRQPRLITYQLQHVKEATFCIKEEMGFDKDEMKALILNKPKLWMLVPDELVERFDYVHRIMSLTHQDIVRSPEILTSRKFRLQQRHEFLKLLGKAQYDPRKDLYVSPKSLVEGRDLEFVINVAKSNMETYDKFLRTL